MRYVRTAIPFLIVLALPLALPGCLRPHAPAAASASSSARPDRALRDSLLADLAPHEIACDLADRVGPRLAGSEGDRLAVAWALAKMNEIGLANVRAEPVKVRHWERGAAAAEIVSPVRQPLVLAALGGSVATPAKGIEAQVVRVESLEALRAVEDSEVEGKIVFFDKPMARRAPDGWSAYGAAVDVRGAGAAAAAKKGAVASVIRSIGTSNARFPHTGTQSKGGAPIPAAALAIPDAEILARLIAAGPVRMRLALETWDRGDAESANVIGEVVGREKPDEIVLIGAHLDSWDLGTGAVDDAAGVGAVLEIGRRLLENPPRRTVRIVLFANEENGLRGAFEYASAHAESLAKHQAALEMDAGAGRALGLKWTGADSSEPVMRRIGTLLAPLGVQGPEKSDHAGGADLIPLHPSGIPRVGLMQDATRYFDVHHTADDTCDKIVPEELIQATAAALIVVRELADEPTLLDRGTPDPD